MATGNVCCSYSDVASYVYRILLYAILCPKNMPSISTEYSPFYVICLPVTPGSGFIFPISISKNVRNRYITSHWARIRWIRNFKQVLNVRSTCYIKICTRSLSQPYVRKVSYSTIDRRDCDGEPKQFPLTTLAKVSSSTHLDISLKREAN